MHHPYHASFFNSFSHAIGFCFDERSAALLSSRMRSLIGPRRSDYPHALSACYYFLQAVFLLALGLWSSLPARQLSLVTSYSFLTFSGFFLFFFFLSTERIDESYIKAPTATSNCRLTTSEDAWAFLGDKADMPLAYRVKVHKCAGLLAAL